MGVIVPIITELPRAGEGAAIKVVWTDVTTGDTGAPVEVFGYNDRSVQVEGTFSGATCTIQGSLDAVLTGSAVSVAGNYEALRDPSSTSLTFTTAGLKGVLEMVRTIRPSVAAGAGTLTVTMLCARTK